MFSVVFYKESKNLFFSAFSVLRGSKNNSFSPRSSLSTKRKAYKNFSEYHNNQKNSVSKKSQHKLSFRAHCFF